MRSRSIMMWFSVGGAVCGIFCVIADGREVVLVPDATSKQVYVLDLSTGDVQSAFSISGYTTSPVEVIDGPVGSLLLSDQVRDMVFQLNSTGAYIKDFLQDPADKIRGIAYISGGLVGATGNGLFTWSQSGVEREFHFRGDYFDVAGVSSGALTATNVVDDNLEAYRTKNGHRLGSTASGEIDFPQQSARIDTASGVRVAVNSSSGQAICVYGFDGVLDYSFDVGGFGRGVVQLESGNLLVTTNEGLFEYAVEGSLVRQIMSGSGFRFLSRSKNYGF